MQICLSRAVLLLALTVSISNSSKTLDELSNLFPHTTEDAEGDILAESEWLPRTRAGAADNFETRLFLQQYKAAQHLLGAGKSNESLQMCGSVLLMLYAHAPCLNVVSLVLDEAGQYRNARKAARDAIDADPSWTDSYHLLARLLSDQASRCLARGNVEGAYESYRQILLLDIDGHILPRSLIAKAYLNLGSTMQMIGMLEHARSNFEKAMVVEPSLYEAHEGLVEIMLEKSRVDLSFPDASIFPLMEKTLSIQHSWSLWFKFVRVRQSCFDWTDRPTLFKRATEIIRQDISFDHCSIHPSLLLDLSIPAQFVSRCIQLYMQNVGTSHKEVAKMNSRNLEQTSSSASSKLKVLYLVSKSFTADSVDSQSLHILFEMHNRSDFHIICGLINRNVVEHQLTLQRQQHVSAACDALVILHAMGTSEESAEQQIAKEIVELSIDILVDLCGHDELFSAPLLSSRPARLQLTWLGFPASFGEITDYKLTDPLSTPPELISLYSEPLLHLPRTHVFTGRARDEVPTFEAVTQDEEMRLLRSKLEHSKFVFAFAGDLARIDEDRWHAWMEVMRIVKNSALLLLSQPAYAKLNLDEHALQYGINPSRLVLWEVKRGASLSRFLSLADLVLDSSHAIDPWLILESLRAPCPVLSLPGQQLYERSTAAALSSLSLHDIFLARDLLDYEQLAVKLAMHPDTTRRSKSNLSHALELHTNRQISSPPPSRRLQGNSFDMVGGVRLLERAYRTIWDLYQSDLIPRIADEDTISLDPPRKFHVIIS